MNSRRNSWWSHMSLSTFSVPAISLNGANFRKQQSTFITAKKNFFPDTKLSPSFKFFSKILIDADSKLKLIWDLIIIFQAILLSFIIPYSLSFFNDFSKNLYFLSSGLFLFDILLTFNTTTYSDGTLISSRSIIATNYLKTDFFIDILSGFPFEWFFLDLLDLSSASYRTFETNREYLRFLLLLKLLKLHKGPKILYQIHAHYPQESLYTLIKIFNYFLIAAFPAHWLTCLFNILYVYALQSPVYYDVPILDDPYSRYLKLLERVVQTMTSVGYGEFSPRTYFERLLSIIVMAITSGLLGIFAGAINQVIEKSSENTIFFRRAMQKLHVFMRLNRVPEELRFRIKDYVRCLQVSYREHLIREQDIVEVLSVPLKEQIFLYTRGFVLMKINEFRDLSPNTLNALGYKLNLNFYAPADVILRQGEKTSDLFFIFHGSVSIIHDKTGTEFAELTRGSYFGEIAFFTGHPRTASAVAKNYSEVFSLSMRSFKRIIQQNPKDNEKILVVFRNLHTYGIAFIRISCFLCKSLGHVAKDCEGYMCRPDLRKIAEKYRERQGFSQRQLFQRLDRNVNMFTKYNLRFVKGRSKKKIRDSEGKFLHMRMVQYNKTVKTFKSENKQIFTIINDLEKESQGKDSESEESEKDFISLAVARLDTQWSNQSLYLK